MFGPIMRFEVGELQIELAPLRRDDMPSFIENGGMQSHHVTKYLGRISAPVLEDEYEWFDHMRSDKASYCWGIYVIAGEERILVGNTSIHIGDGTPMSHATTGCLIFCPEYWGKGIASHCHRARTWFGFCRLGLVELRSAVLDGNDGSRRALEGVGYVPIFHERNQRLIDGKFVGMTSFSMVSPLKYQWKLWWHGDNVPAEFRAARNRSRAALMWAEEHVSFG